MAAQANDAICTSSPGTPSLVQVKPPTERDKTKQAAGDCTLIAHVKATSTGLACGIARDRWISVECVRYSGPRLMILAWWISMTTERLPSKITSLADTSSSIRSKADGISMMDIDDRRETSLESHLSRWYTMLH
jgi:hypothetical protein